MGQPDINVYSVKITSVNTDTQIFRSPWLVNRSYIIQTITITNEGSAAIVKFYDNDLSSGGVPPTLGNSGTGPLLEYNVGANATLVIDRKMCPHKRFISGMVGNSNAVVHVVVEVKED